MTTRYSHMVSNVAAYSTIIGEMEVSSAASQSWSAVREVSPEKLPANLGVPSMGPFKPALGEQFVQHRGLRLGLKLLCVCV